LRATNGAQYGDDHALMHSGATTEITKEVLAMITTTYATKRRQADLGMPASRCAQAAWQRALPEFTGVVSVLGTDVHGDARIDVRTATAGLIFPGTSAWSPPT
jgi:hypothetical protein